MHFPSLSQQPNRLWFRLRFQPGLELFSLMNCSLFTAAIFVRTARFVAKNRSLTLCPSSFSFPRKSEHCGVVRSFRSELVLTRFRTRCYSTRKGRKSGSSSRLQKVEEPEMEQQEKDAFFVVRKGDVVGIYNSLSDSHAQVGSSVILFGNS